MGASARPALIPGEWMVITPKAAGVDPAANVFCQGMALDPSDPSVLYLCVCAFDVSKPMGLYSRAAACGNGSAYAAGGRLRGPFRPAGAAGWPPARPEFLSLTA